MSTPVCTSAARAALAPAAGGRANRASVAARGRGIAAIPAAVDQALRSPGRPLDAGVRSLFEHHLGRIGTPPVPSLRVGEALPAPRADDPLEREADRVADRFVSGMPDPSGALAAASGRAGPAPRVPFAADFARVRVHTGPAAVAAARSVGARAFSLGDDLVFGEGGFDPLRPAGLRLLAHELAHVVQRVAGRLLRKGSGDAPQMSPVDHEADDKDDDAEAVALQSPVAAPDAAPGAAHPLPVQSAAAHADADGPAATGPRRLAPASAAPAGMAPREPAGPKSAGELSTGDLGLIDEELAEHERWGAAGEVAGAAGSGRRAGFIADHAGEGASKGLKKGLVSGATMGAGMKVAEKIAEKAAVAVAVRLGGQAARFVPLPGIGAMIGGVMAAYDLGKRDWGETRATIQKFGQGSDLYEQLANSIEAYSTALEVTTQVVNVIAGILGYLTLMASLATVASGGAAVPLLVPMATTLAATGAATLALDAINALVFKELVATFRALHLFASEADPRDVVAQGSAIEEAAGAATGFVGGLVGAKAAEHGMHQGVKATKKIASRGKPPAATGAGPVVVAEPPNEAVQEAKADLASPHEGGSAEAPNEPAPKTVPESKEASSDKPAPAQQPAPQKPAAPGEPPPAIETAPKEAVAEAAPPQVEVEAVPEKAGTPSEDPAPVSKSGEAEPGAGKAKPGQIDEASFEDLDDLVAAKSQGEFGEELAAESANRQARPPTPRRSWSKRQAARARRRWTRKARKAWKLTGGEVQAGHTRAVRHSYESGAPDTTVNDPSTFQQLPSRHGRGLDAEVTDQYQNKKTLTRHNAQEGLINANVDRARNATREALGDKHAPLTPEGQAEAGDQVLWQTRGTGLDFREVQQKRASRLIDEKVDQASLLDQSKAVQAYREQRAAQPSKAVGGAAVETVPSVADVAGSGSPSAASATAAETVVAKESAFAPAAEGATPSKPSGPPRQPLRPGRQPGGDFSGDLDEYGQSAIERHIEATIDEQLSGSPPVDQDFVDGIEEQRPQASRRGDGRDPWRTQTPERVKKSLRKEAAKRFARQMQEALLDEGRHTALTQEALTHLTPKQQASVRKTGRMPKGFEFHHLLTVADFPEYAHLAESGLSVPKDVHVRQGHGGQTARPIEAATWVDPGAMERPGYKIDAEAQKYHRAKAEEIASGQSQHSKRAGGIDADLVTQFKARLKELRREQEMQRKLDKKPGANVAKEIEALERQIQQLGGLKAKAAKPAKAGTATKEVAAPEVSQPATAAVPETAPAESSAAPSNESTPLAPKQTAPAAAVQAPALAQASPVQANPANAAPVSAAPGAQTQAEEPAPASAATQAAASHAAPDAPHGPTHTPAQAEAPSTEAKAIEPTPEPEPDTPAATPAGVGAAKSGVEGAQPGAAPASPKADGVEPPNASAKPEHAEPIIERVNPAYQPPPGTPDDLVSLRNQIIDTLQARSVAQDHATAMGAQVKHHEANEKPVEQMKGGTNEALRATEAHKRAVAHRDEANERKKGEEQKTRSTIDGYANRAGALVAIRLPMKGLSKLSGLAHSLPDEPAVVQRFKNNVLKVNKDSTSFVGQLDQMDAAVAGQKAQQDVRRQGVEADAATLKQTGATASHSHQSLEDAKQSADDFEQKNKERKDDATSQRKDAHQLAAHFATQAAAKQQQSVSLAAAMQFWARGHARTRAEAIEQTRQRLQAMGYRVTEVREK